MSVLLKFKNFLCKKNNKKAAILSNHSPSPPSPKYASPIALTTEATGADVEDHFPNVLYQATYHEPVVHIQAPLSIGALEIWIDELSFLGLNRTSIIPILLSLYGAQDEKNIITDAPNYPSALRFHSTDINPPQDPSSTVLFAWSPIESGDSRLCIPGSIVAGTTPIDSSAGVLSIGENLDIDHTRLKPSSSSCTTSIPQRRTSLSHKCPPQLEPTTVSTPLGLSLPPLDAITTQKPFSLGDFAITHRLGSGTFGTVHAVYHKTTKLHAALKCVSKRWLCDDDEIENGMEGFSSGHGVRINREEIILRSAIDEFFSLRRCEGVRGVLQLHASYHDTENFYFVTEICPGGDLRQLLDRFHHLPQEQVLFYAAELIIGLEGLHSRGIVHRDLKPSNILINASGHLVIADFGLARCFPRGATEEETMLFGIDHDDIMSAEVTKHGCGTGMYMAPEIYEAKEFSYPVDVWAFGVILFIMLTGRSPWDSKHDKGPLSQVISFGEVIFDDWERVAYHLTESSESFVHYILDKDPSTRPTATRLKSHRFFSGFDWDALIKGNSPAPWIPDSQVEGDSQSSIEPGRDIYPFEDPLPFFNFTSPILLPKSKPATPLSSPQPFTPAHNNSQEDGKPSVIAAAILEPLSNAAGSPTGTPTSEPTPTHATYSAVDRQSALSTILRRLKSWIGMVGGKFKSHRIRS